MRVLLIYATLFKKTGLPVGVASLSAVLKKDGHDVKVIDTAFYDSHEGEYASMVRSKRLMSKEVVNEDQYFSLPQSDIMQDLGDIINNFKPDLVGISILEPNYSVSCEIAKFIKKNSPDAPIIAGGVFPSLSPKHVIAEYFIDMVCVGEGEDPLVELCQRISKGESYDDIDGIWVKKNGKVIDRKTFDVFK